MIRIGSSSAFASKDTEAMAALYHPETTFHDRCLESWTGRRVRNVVQARLTVRDGLIVRHTDAFSFWRWSRQALGLPGWLLGWTPLLRAKV